MSSQPLVSVMMPAFNAEYTIDKAIKSLQLQTYESWECVIVDDGSTDDTVAIINSIQDDRIRLIKLEKNMGRGYARQVALENCHGEYVAMLDADDWYYNGKLQAQVEAFNNYPELGVVSCGMAVTNTTGDISGVRSIGDNQVKFFDKPTTVPVPHAPSMYRKSLAENIRYDSRFKLAQDVDFLRRLLVHEKYMLLDMIGYVYEEQQSNSPKKIFQGYYYSARGYLKFLPSFPITAVSKSTFEIAKLIRLMGYTALGKFDVLIASRSLKPTLLQQREFNAQLKTLDDKQ